MNLRSAFFTIALCLSLGSCATAVSSLQKQGLVYQIQIPASASVIEFPADGFRVNQADNARPYYYLSNDKSHLNVSFNFEPAKKCATSLECRDYLLEKLRAASFKRNWSTSKVGQVYVSENMDGPINGLFLRQQHMNAHYVIDGVWVDVHMSKVDYREADRQIFVDFLRSIRIKSKNLSARGPAN